MAAKPGLRERKKLQTRQQIFEASWRLFTDRGFDGVTVAAVADEANVSEMTVYNYFPTKEDLFYAGMQMFEEELVEAVRDRPRGETAFGAFQRRVLEGAGNLASSERADGILRAGRVIAASSSLQAREREIVEAYTRRLAEVLRKEARSAKRDLEPVVAAAAMMSAHRALVDYIRERVAAGRRGPRLAGDFRAQARRAFARLEHGLAGYAVRR
jgi:AcrR family transcriptional regulator